MSLFENRHRAGLALAQALKALHLEHPVVLAVARGGLPVALPVAQALGAPLDLLLVRKIGVPWQPELAAAAITDGPTPHLTLDETVMRECHIDPAYIEAQARIELKEIERRRRTYLGEQAPAPVAGRCAIVVDDGLATGTTMRAALRAVRQRHPARLVMAVPVAARDSLQALRSDVDQVVCLAQPEPFDAVGLHYQSFDQVSDAEVIALMHQAQTPHRPIGVASPDHP